MSTDVLEHLDNASMTKKIYCTHVAYDIVMTVACLYSVEYARRDSLGFR